MVLGSFLVLFLSTCGIAIIHTVSGPDHYLPFIALSKSRKWNYVTTMAWTLFCGMGHLISSLMIGMLGVLMGWGMHRYKILDDIRGGLSGWLMFFFGAIYLLWATQNVYRNKSHKHFESDDAGDLFVFEHRHGEVMIPKEKYKVTPWVIFVIFFVSPAEPLIPLFFAPSLQQAYFKLSLLIIGYVFSTLLSMTVMVMIGLYGLQFKSGLFSERYMSVLSACVLLLTGIGMIFFNW